MRSHRRREFLKGLTASVGAGFLLAPFLDSIAEAAPGRKPKRLLLFCTMGTATQIWKPTSVSGETPTFSESTAPLADVKQHVVLVDGLPSGNPGNNHGAPDGLTGLGFGGGPAGLISVDQFIADKLVAAGVKTPIASLLLGAESTVSGGRSPYYRADNLPTIASPTSAYSTLFGSAVPVNTSSEDLLRRRKSVLDHLKNEIRTLGGDLASEQKYKLDLHLESIRQIETRLSNASSGEGGGCAPPTKVATDPANPLQANLAHMDLIVGAFACDITRVAAIQWGSDQAMNVELPEIGLRGEEHGSMIHTGAPAHLDLVKLEKWLAQRFVDLITKLKAIPEADGSGTLFDNTLIAWCRDMGDSPNHNMNEMKFVLASGDGGYLKTSPGGRYVRSSDRHERVLLSLCDAMGVTDFAGFGDPNLPSKSPLPGLAAS
ncbi:DUF1552 domain-containing protein [Sorangium cellulosum]|uniref:Uncharacterized protein n=1 Tax=Sorangium cellulosum TaxID=56 RepID=A0A150Q2B5_SORCE|nr:DUF1552 domain-containing protein [Sorangium cellulosum]KYF61886.1 hypothetical protein BE15_37980 [Sorangium cellulosum]